MLGSVGGLVVVISKVVDNVGASDAGVVLETVEGYVERSLIFVVLVCSVDISKKNVVLSVVVDIVIIVVEMVAVAGLELKISVVEYVGVVGDNVVLVCSEGFAMSAAKAFINGVVLVVLELGIVDDSAIVVAVEVVMVLVSVKGVGETVVDDVWVPSAAKVEVGDTELGVTADAVAVCVAEVGFVSVLVRIN